jgi:hypothetical protein
MKTNIVIATLFCASAVLAAPFTELRRERRQTRARRTLRPQNLTSAVETDGLAGTDSINVQYSTNWAGLVLIGSGYTSVTGTIVVPTPKKPSGGNTRTQYSASAWVGIDGDTCDSAILQTGLDFYIQGNQVSFDGWYEWYPDYAYNFDSFALSAGDTVQMTVTASSTGSGIATLDNISTGQSVSHSFSGESASLCETNAEWIVEDFSEGNSLVPLADFTTVTFTGASAVSHGSTVDTTGATVLDIRQNNQVLTSCSGSGDVVTCTYI